MTKEGDFVDRKRTEKVKSISAFGTVDHADRACG